MLAIVSTAAFFYVGINACHISLEIDTLFRDFPFTNNAPLE